MIPADKILSFLALLETTPRLMNEQSAWHDGFHDGRAQTLTQVRAYVEAVLANQDAPTFRQIEEGVA